MESLLDAAEAIDGLVCASDLIALGAMRWLHEHSIDVPRDIAVVGFDDIEAAAHCTPTLTTMRQDVKEAGETLVEVLLQLIETGDEKSRLLEPRLVVRESCGGTANR